MKLFQQDYDLLKGKEKILDNGEVRFFCPSEGLDLCIYKKDSEFSNNVVMEDMKYIVLDAKVLEANNLV